MTVVVPEVLDQNARTNLWLRRVAVVAIALFLLLNAVTALSVVRVAQAGREQGAYNARLLSIVLEVSGCTVDDEPGRCAARLGLRSINEGTRRIIEVDCATRRALVGLPAHEPARSCVEQTPPDVYPG